MSHHADIFVHYSNLDAAMRRDVEERFAASPVAICVSTSTLELGVDIDSVDDVALLGAPPEQIAVLPQERGHFLFHFWGTVWGELLTAVLVANGTSADFVNEYCLAVPQPITQLPPWDERAVNKAARNKAVTLANRLEIGRFHALLPADVATVATVRHLDLERFSHVYRTSVIVHQPHIYEHLHLLSQ